MQRHRRAIVLSIVLATLSIAAGPPVALRVETAAVRPEGDATVVSITVQAAPEDRARLGRDVWVQGELLRRGERVNRVARAVDLDERGQAAFEVAWPPGDYELRVSIEAVSGKAAGVWVGRLVVPVLTAAAPPPPASTVPPPAPAAAAATRVAASPVVAPTPAPQPAIATPVPPTPERGVEPTPTAVPEPASEPTPVEAPAVAVAATVAAAAGAAEAAPSATEPAPQPAPAAPVPSAREPVDEPPAEPTPVEVAAAAAAATAAAAVAAEAAPSATEPARQPASVTPVPPTSERVVEPTPTAVLEPVAEPTPVEAAAGAWATAHPGMADLTVIVTERNRPILGLDRSAFRLRVGGSPATVEAAGDRNSAPLNLAIVADLGADAGDLVDEVARQLGRFSLRTRDGGALLVAGTAAPKPGWGASADDILGWADAAAAGRPDDLAGLLASAAESFAGRRGRSFLVVVTDGSDNSGKAAWKDAAAAVEGAGVPVFVVGLRDSGFDDQARAGLSRAAEVTGGRSYYLGAAGMAGMTLDYLGELIDASYALAYRPPAAGPGPREARVEVVNRDWQVHAPRRVP